MKDNNFSINGLSKKSGAGYATLYDIISGKAKNPRIGTLIRIANTLNVPLQNLLEEKENEKSDTNN